jgi:hypothetical protein
VRTISLSRGYSAVVDDEDYEFLSQWQWHVCVGSQAGKLYAMRNSDCVDGKRSHVLMHRVINQTPPGFDTDHINGDGLDNQRRNLRTASRSQNMWNRKPNKKGASRHKGVYWHAQHQKWCASIQVNKKRHRIGLFSDERDAANAYFRQSRARVRRL